MEKNNCVSSSSTNMDKYPSNNNYKLKKDNEQKSTTIQQQLVDVIVVITELIALIISVIYYSLLSLYRLIVPVQLKSVKGEIVLITGAGHGIGKQLAIDYAKEGAIVVCWDINPESNASTVKEIKEEIGEKAKVYAYKCNVANREEVLEVAKKVQKDVGDVTILINNAGIMPSHRFEDHSEEEIRRVMDINVFAHFWTLQAFLPAMKKMNRGHIVAMSSIAGVVGIVNLLPYCASKFAVRGIMETLTLELRKVQPNNQIRTTTICPYMVDTGLCKKPVVKFPNFMPLLDPKKVAEEIMFAQRTEMCEVTVPRYLMKVNYMARLTPFFAMLKVRDFFDSGVEPDD